MADTEVFEKKDNTPLESYSFTYSEAEYNEANRGVFKGLLVRTVVFGVVFAAVTAGAIIGDLKSFFGGMLVGWTLMYFVLSVAGLFRTRQGWKSTKDRVCSSLFEYQLFDTYMLLTVSRDGKQVHFTTLEYDKLISKVNTGGFYVLNFANQLYLVKKQEIAENSIFHTLKPKAPEKPGKGAKAVSAIFMVLTIVTLVCALISAVAVNINSVGVVRYWWYLYVFLPIPLFSYGLGLYMKRKHNFGRGNIIVGLVAIILVISVYFSFNNIAKDTTYPDKNENIASIESYIGFFLPEPESYDNFKDSVNGIDYEDTAMKFDAEAGDYIEDIIKIEDNWSAVLSDDTYELVSEVGTLEHWDMMTVYNITTDQYNKVPAESGVYSMAAMYYDMDANGLYVIEYEYVK